MRSKETRIAEQRNTSLRNPAWVQTYSNATTRLILESASWVPGLPFSDRFQRYYSCVQSIYARMFTGLLFILTLTGCESKPPSTYDAPMIKIHGIKPVGLDIGVGIQYIATSDYEECKTFSFAAGTYLPVERRQRTWSTKSHPEESQVTGNVHTNVVPIQSSQGHNPHTYLEANRQNAQNGERFAWDVSAQWAGQDQHCSFVPIRIAPLLYTQDQVVGGLALEVNLGLGLNRFLSSYKKYTEDKKQLQCSVRSGGEYERCVVQWENDNRIEPRGYRLDTLRSDTLRVKMHVN